MVALRMANYVKRLRHFPYRDGRASMILEIGRDPRTSCVLLTIGTRLHSAIISMNFGTPAIAINYERQIAGITCGS